MMMVKMMMITKMVIAIKDDVIMKRPKSKLSKLPKGKF